MGSHEGSDVGAQQPNSDRFDELFRFTMPKWHNCCMYEYTIGLTSFRKELRRKKGAAVRENMSLRDGLEGQVGFSSGKGTSAGKKTKAAMTAKKKAPITQAHRDRAAQLASMIGSSSFERINVRHLREYILECGVKAPTSMNRSDLQSLLRQVASDIGLDIDLGSEEDTTSVAGAGVQTGTCEAVESEKTD